MANEKRLIDANALELPRYSNKIDDEFVQGYRYGKTDAILEIMALAPTVDAVEVVRCKDCRHSILPELMTAECTYWHEVVGINGFCHHGERKDNDT